MMWKLRRSGVRVKPVAIIVLVIVFIVAMATMYVSKDYTVKAETPKSVDGKLVTINEDRDFNPLKRMENSPALGTNIKGQISEIAKLLHRAKIHVRGTKTSDNLRKASKLMDDLLTSLDINKDKLVRRKVLSPKNVCPEKYIGPQEGYPMYYRGFEKTNCSYHRPLSDLVTVVAFIKDIDVRNLSTHVSTFLKSLTVHSSIPVRIATSPNLDPMFNFPENVIYLPTYKANSDGWIWNKLTAEVRTQYVLIARDADVYTEDARLERLVREMEIMQVSVSAGAVRYPKGHWKKGCYQSVHINFTLKYLEGYDESLHECLFCDYVLGPFITSTETLKSVPFTESDVGDGLFEDWFLKLTKKGIDTIVCPDSMFHIRKGKKYPNWKPFIDHWGLYKLVSPLGDITLSDCTMVTNKSVSKAHSPCHLKANAYAVKYIMSMCQKRYIFCELQDGTSLGAVKMENVLPWEWDADIRFLSDNFTSVQKFGAHLETKNFTILQTGWNKYIVRFLGWDIEMYGQDKLDSEMLSTSGNKPTRVLINGEWHKAPRNPGLVSRNHYGPEMYQHAIHWRNSGAKTEYDQYEPLFPPCESPGEHDCLDRYNTDGNIQFSDPLP